jgi:hypothetical protein
MMDDQKHRDGPSPGEGVTRRQKIIATLVVVGGSLAWGLFVAFGKHRARQTD